MFIKFWDSVKLSMKSDIKEFANTNLKKAWPQCVSFSLFYAGQDAAFNINNGF